MDGLPGAPLGDVWYVDVTGAMLGNLRAVPWLAETEPWGGDLGGVVVEGEKGEIRMLPKGSKAEGVIGTASMVIVDEGAIVEFLWFELGCLRNDFNWYAQYGLYFNNTKVLR